MPAPAAKRAKPLASCSSTASGSRDALFAPFRSLGHISTSTPFALQSRSGKYLETPAVTVLTSLGSSWAIWEGQSLRLLFVGPEMGAPITSLAFDLESNFAAAGSSVGRFARGKLVHNFVLQSASSSSASSSSSSSSASSSASDSDSDSDSDDESPSASSTVLTHLTIFGTTLLAFSAGGKTMHVWDVPQLVNAASVDPSAEASTSKALAPVAKVVTPYLTIDFPTGFTANSIVHPASYLNKIVVGSKEGELAVWNVRTGSCIHTFPAAALSSVTSASAVTFLEQSPALDVLGVGLANGSVVLFDVRMGEVLGKVRLEGEGVGEVAGVAFRNDDNAQTLAVSSSAGHVALFDLGDKMKLLHLLRAVHDGPVGGMQWVPGQPLLMTSGGDNSVKQWLFDSPSAQPRLLKQRSGHHAPPHLVRYYGEDGKAVLTAGADRALRYTSIVRDSRGYELSQGSIQRKATHLGVKPSSLKLPVITSLAYSTARSKEWDDLVTTSTGESLGRSWSVEGKRQGAFNLPTSGVVTTSCVSACGNFGMTGNAAGEVVLHNMQSGLKRKVFKVPANPLDANLKNLHITGIATDSLNRVAIVSTLKGEVHFFDFQTMKLRRSITLPASVTALNLHRENNLLAVTCDDLVVRIVDIETCKIVREFFGPRGRILDLAFSPDGRWVITTSQDGVIRTFDVPTGQLVDAFRTPSVATSLSFSPTGDFLATAHVDSVGVYLWANRAQFTDVSLRSFVEEDLEDVALPTVQGVDLHEGLTEIRAPVKWEDVQPYTTPDQLAEELLTLSLMPRSRWATLLNLDTIKARNKPKEAPKAPERAPFFLPILPGTKHRFDFATQAEASTTSAEDGRRKLDMGSASVETEFVRRMLAESEGGDYGAFFEYLKSLSPSATDLELRSLSTLPQLSLFLSALTGRLKSHRDFEAVQTFLALFLRVHGDVLVQNTELAEGLRAVREEQKREAGRLVELTHKALGTIAFLRGTPIA